MGFEWDQRKRKANLRHHKTDFVDVLPVFEGTTLETVDDRFDYGETRVRCMGETDGRVYAVVSTPRAANRRIISARRANAGEKYITRVRAEQARRLKGKSDLGQFGALSDDDIARAAAADPDAVPLDTDWTKARLVLPPGKELVTLRVDRDVLEWLRKTARVTRPISTRCWAPTRMRTAGQRNQRGSLRYATYRRLALDQVDIDVVRSVAASSCDG